MAEVSFKFDAADEMSVEQVLAAVLAMRMVLKSTEFPEGTTEAVKEVIKARQETPPQTGNPVTKAPPAEKKIPKAEEATPASAYDEKPHVGPNLPEADDTVFTEEEMIDMPSDELTVILQAKYGIDPKDHPGKNTNKKLRDLILKAQNGEIDGTEGDEESEEEEKPKSAPKTSPKGKAKAVEPEDDDDEDGDLTLDDIKKRMHQVFQDNKPAIRKRFTAYGVAKVSELQEENFRDFYDFLGSLGAVDEMDF